MLEDERAPRPLRVRVSDSEHGSWSLLCVHGYGDNLQSWNEVRAIVEPRGARVVALDLPGFGASPLPAWARARWVETAVALVRRALAELPPPRLVLGNSLGGSVALVAQVRDAASTRAIAGSVLLSPASARSRVPPFLRVLRFPVYPALDAACRWLPGPGRRAVARAVARAGFRTILAPGHRPQPAWERSVVRSFLREGAFLEMEHVARELLSILRGERTDVAREVERLGGVPTPVVIARGVADRVIGRAELVRLVDALPRGRYVEIDGSAHCPQSERPEAVAELLLALAAEVGGAPRAEGGSERGAPPR